MTKLAKLLLNFAHCCLIYGRYLETPKDILRASVVAKEWENILSSDSMLCKKLQEGRKEDSSSCTPILPENKRYIAKRREALLEIIENPSPQEDPFEGLIHKIEQGCRLRCYSSNILGLRYFD
ncbi:uncharacterized protein [Leptinotarsa decemlineata]|uniref:uncharacterized protein n=1 Tax=Leptinotarsa decemlineata TaxID=7539 RepID=UPI003D30C9D5